LKTALGKLVDNKKMIQRSNGNSSINECDSPACRKVALQVKELQSLLDIKADGIDGITNSITDCLYMLECLHLYLPASKGQIDEQILKGQIDGKMELVGKKLEEVRTFVQRAFMRQENPQMGPIGKMVERARVSAKRTLAWQNPLSRASLSALKKAMAQLASRADMIQLPNGNFSINKCDNPACREVASQIEELQILLDTKASKVSDIVSSIAECLHQPVSQKEIDAQMGKIEKIVERTRTFMEENDPSKTDRAALLTVLFKLASRADMIQLPNGNFSINDCDDPACRKVVSQIEELETLFRARAVASTRQSVELDQQRIAAEMASECFDASGKIDLDKARELRDRIKSSAALPGEFSTIPGASLMLSQVSCVLDNLIDHAQETGSLREIIDETSKLSPGSHGRQILGAMGDNLKSPVKPGEAILISLFSLHRQKGLPSCTMDSIINAELRNHPEKIAKIFEQILAGFTFNFPSGRLAHQQQIIREDGRCYIPIDMVIGDRRERDEIIARENLHNCLSSGIRRDSSNSYGLLIPVKDLNDVFFANFFQNSGFGHEVKSGLKPLSIEGAQELSTMFTYQGIDSIDAFGFESGSKRSIYSDQKISVAGISLKAGVERLKAVAMEQKAQGMHYMRVATTSMGGCHDENVDIDALLKLDLDALEVGKPHIIGDRNWVNEEGHPKFLAIVKTIDPSTNVPTCSFQTVCSEDHGDPMEEADIWRFDIYQPSKSSKDEIKKTMA
jgi:predicted component of type VI protein secretion system